MKQFLYKMNHVFFFFVSFFLFIHRGFGFITFDDPSSVDKVLAHGTHELDGKKVSIKMFFIRISFLFNCRCQRCCCCYFCWWWQGI